MGKKIALVTGGNRGIGLEVVKGLLNQGDTIVWLGTRDLDLGQDVADQLVSPDLKVVKLDVNNPEDIASAYETITQTEGRGIDILVNNAGVLFRDDSVLTGKEETFWLTFNTNVAAIYHLIRTFVPDMVKQNYGRIVNVSSGWGAFSDGLNGPFSYSFSKAALNALTLILSQELPDNVKVNAMSPGWVHTRMGGENAPLTPEEGAQTIIWLANLPEDGPSGQYFRDKKVAPW
ncbi:MAG: SDR family NAD(P)-dependent oxidoreductase [Legionellales bacterium]|jgi:NAD(P)-dependent dehydrogenase (short-subunit alcohol dehydrogenase family)